MIEGKDYEIIDGHLKIFEGVTKIPAYEFSHKNITSVEMPDTVSVIECCAFEYCNINSIKFSNNLVEIGASAFRSNKLKNVVLPNRLYRIEKYAFCDNELESVTFSERLEYIGICAFANNFLIEANLPKYLKSIENQAFGNNNLINLNIPSNVEIIGDGAFRDNELTNLTIENGVSQILSSAFRNNNLTSVHIPESVTNIGAYAFRENNLTDVEIPGSVKIIDAEAFASNNLTSIKLQKGITVIKWGAFFENNLTSVEIPESVTNIDSFAFNKNNLTSVKIPKSVTIIQFKAFDNINIIYDGTLIKKELVEKFGCQNVIKVYEISKVISPEKILEIPKDLIGVVPATNDALKGYIVNKKEFDLLADPEIYKNEEYRDIFKLCFTLGLFNKPEKDNIMFIIKILHDNDIDYIHQMFTAVKLDYYKPKFKDLFMKLYKEGKTDYNGNNIIGRLYSSFDKINKYTIKRHEEIMSKKNTEIKRLKELGANTTFLEEELENLKKNKKNISYEDIVYYIKNNTFDIKEGNEDLKDVVDTLSVHIEQDGFDKIQDIYEESKVVIKTIPLTIDKSGSDIKYHWSKSDNPINTILGYLVNCCAKLGGAGEDIMRQSMINPDVANLIIYDENNQVMGKATAYYNRKEKYILFNNAETKGITSKGLKSEKQRQKECLEALIRGTMDAVEVLKQRGEDIKEVRIGMLRNDLESAIKEYGLEISHNLLDAYHWDGYSGDASDCDRGQAIIYKDDSVDKNREI